MLTADNFITDVQDSSQARVQMLFNEVGMSYYIGLDLGGTNLKAAVIDDQGGLAAKLSVPTPKGQGPEPVIAAMADAARAVVAQAGLKMSQIAAVGIGSPGPIDLEKGVLVSAPNLSDFRDVPIRDRIAAAIGKPTVLDNDANVAAFAEYWIGAGSDPAIRHLVALTLGTGIGSGLIVDGKIVHGGFGIGGEAGHLIVEPNGRQCGCGQLGCLEAYASASQTALRAAEAVEATGPDQHTALRRIMSDPASELTAKDVFEAAIAGDEIAQRVVEETATYLGIACVNLCRLLDPQMIVLGGGMVQAGDYLLALVRKAYARHDWRMSASRVRIEAAVLGSDAGVIGAGAIACDAHLTGEIT